MSESRGDTKSSIKGNPSKPACDGLGRRDKVLLRLAADSYERGLAPKRTAYMAHCCAGNETAATVFLRCYYGESPHWFHGCACGIHGAMHRKKYRVELPALLVASIKGPLAPSLVAIIVSYTVVAGVTTQADRSPYDGYDQEIARLMLRPGCPGRCCMSCLDKIGCHLSFYMPSVADRLHAQEEQRKGNQEPAKQLLARLDEMFADDAMIAKQTTERCTRAEAVIAMSMLS